MAAIIGLAIVGISSSVIIAETSEGFAAAINQAGTLRMQSYRVAASMALPDTESMYASGMRTQALVDEFLQRLSNERIQNVMAKGASRDVHMAYNQMLKHWEKVLAPLIREYLSYMLAERVSTDTARLTNLRLAYLEQVDSFVESIHGFVRQLEVQAETKIQNLKLIQLVVLVLTLLVVAIVLVLLRRDVLRPLHALLMAATRFRNRDFSARVADQRDDELGQLASAFNLMAADLSQSYEELEQRVYIKTLDLERSNQSLELLYNVSRRLSVGAFGEKVLNELADEIGHLIGAIGGAICLGQSGDEKGYMIAQSSGVSIDALDKKNNCQDCFGDGHARLFQPDHMQDIYRYSTPISEKGEQFGVLLMDFSGTSRPEDWHERMLETVAYHIAQAIQRDRQLLQNRKLVLMEERSVIARELHDSLAQTLSYLKIQVSLLQKLLEADGGKPAAIIEKLRSGLNSAYGELRELLTTFRLRLGEGGFHAELESTVEDFRKRSETRIFLENRLGNCHLHANAEIHLVQIIREALSNVVRHAQASEAYVTIDCDRNGNFTLLVEDDGIGMPQVGNLEHHHGLAIMRERAKGLGAMLHVGVSPLGGTMVKLNFYVTNGQSEQR